MSSSFSNSEISAYNQKEKEKKNFDELGIDLHCFYLKTNDYSRS